MDGISRTTWSDKLRLTRPQLKEQCPRRYAKLLGYVRGSRKLDKESAKKFARRSIAVINWSWSAAEVRNTLITSRGIAHAHNPTLLHRYISNTPYNISTRCLQFVFYLSLAGGFVHDYLRTMSVGSRIQRRNLDGWTQHDASRDVANQVITLLFSK